MRATDMTREYGPKRTKW